MVQPPRFKSSLIRAAAVLAMGLGGLTVLYAFVLFTACMSVSDGFSYHTFDFENGGFKKVFEREEFLRLLRDFGLMVAVGSVFFLGGLRLIQRRSKGLDAAAELDLPVR